MLKNVEKEYIVNFLKSDTGNETEERLVFGAVFNIIFLFVNLIYSQNKISALVIAILLSLLLIIVLFKYTKGIELDCKNFYLCHGIFTCFLVISFGLLSNSFFKMVFGTDAIKIIVVILIGVVLFGGTNLYVFVRRIERNDFKFGVSYFVATPAVVLLGILIIRPLVDVVDKFLLLGVLCGIITIVSAGNIYFLIKYYCYKILEQETCDYEMKNESNILVISQDSISSKKAKAWLSENQISYETRNINMIKIKVAEIKKWHEKSGVPINMFFNTSGNAFKSMKLDKRIMNMTSEEKYTLLVRNSQLLKLPIYIGNDFVLLGFKEHEWREKILHDLKVSGSS